MSRYYKNYYLKSVSRASFFRVTLFILVFSGCGGSDVADVEQEVTPPPPPIVDTEPGNDKQDTTFSSAQATSRFLNQATFGSTHQQIQALTGTNASAWFKQQLGLPATLLSPVVDEFSQYIDEEGELSLFAIEATTFGFWKNSITAEDQLRQRMAFALSEILVVSNGGGEVLTDIPMAVASYEDLLITHAFGNYRELLEAVTYSPAMGYYLTYLGSEKGDEATGRMPDENYAREILQLFTIGVTALNIDGSVKNDEQGNAIETYSNQDITGLARVFTGLNLNEELLEESSAKAFAAPMVSFAESHSQKEKYFLGYRIPEDTDAKTSIDLALDHIFSHANVAPFIGKQLIQRLVTSNPTSDYVARVATAFEQGAYELPDGTKIGDDRRGDLTATLAAILFDDEARQLGSSTSGKIREPILRFTHWARAFNVENITPQFQYLLWDTSASSALAQHPYRSPSVFNFFRPGYVAPGSLSGAQQLVAPELQITNASSIPGYINFMTFYIMGEQQELALVEIEEIIEEAGRNIDADEIRNSFKINYDAELNLIAEPELLIDHLDLVLTYGTASDATKNRMTQMISQLLNDEEEELFAVQIAILMMMTSPDYLVQE